MINNRRIVFAFVALSTLCGSSTLRKQQHLGLDKTELERDEFGPLTSFVSVQGGWQVCQPRKGPVPFACIEMELKKLNEISAKTSLYTEQAASLEKMFADITKQQAVDEEKAKEITKTSSNVIKFVPETLVKLSNVQNKATQYSEEGYLAIQSFMKKAKEGLVSTRAKLKAMMKEKNSSSEKSLNKNVIKAYKALRGRFMKIKVYADSIRRDMKKQQVKLVKGAEVNDSKLKAAEKKEIDQSVKLQEKEQNESSKVHDDESQASSDVQSTEGDVKVNVYQNELREEVQAKANVNAAETEGEKVIQGKFQDLKSVIDAEKRKADKTIFHSSVLKTKLKSQDEAVVAVKKQRLSEIRSVGKNASVLIRKLKKRGSDDSDKQTTIINNEKSKLSILKKEQESDIQQNQQELVNVPDIIAKDFAEAKKQANEDISTVFYKEKKNEEKMKDDIGEIKSSSNTDANAYARTALSQLIEGKGQEESQIIKTETMIQNDSKKVKEIEKKGENESSKKENQVLNHIRSLVDEHQNSYSRTLSDIKNIDEHEKLETKQIKDELHNEEAAEMNAITKKAGSMSEKETNETEKTLAAVKKSSEKEKQQIERLNTIIKRATELEKQSESEVEAAQAKVSEGAPSEEREVFHDLANLAYAGQDSVRSSEAKIAGKGAKETNEFASKGRNVSLALKEVAKRDLATLETDLSKTKMKELEEETEAKKAVDSESVAIEKIFSGLSNLETESSLQNAKNKESKELNQIKGETRQSFQVLKSTSDHHMVQTFKKQHDVISNVVKHDEATMNVDERQYMNFEANVNKAIENDRESSSDPELTRYINAVLHAGIPRKIEQIVKIDKQDTFRIQKVEKKILHLITTAVSTAEKTLRSSQADITMDAAKKQDIVNQTVKQLEKVVAAAKEFLEKAVAEVRHSLITNEEHELYQRHANSVRLDGKFKEVADDASQEGTSLESEYKSVSNSSRLEYEKLLKFIELLRANGIALDDLFNNSKGSELNVLTNILTKASQGTDSLSLKIREDYLALINAINNGEHVEESKIAELIQFLQTHRHSLETLIGDSNSEVVAAQGETSQLSTEINSQLASLLSSLLSYQEHSSTDIRVLIETLAASHKKLEEGVLSEKLRREGSLGAFHSSFMMMYESIINFLKSVSLNYSNTQTKLGELEDLSNQRVAESELGKMTTGHKAIMEANDLLTKTGKEKQQVSPLREEESQQVESYKKELHHVDYERNHILSVINTSLIEGLKKVLGEQSHESELVTSMINKSDRQMTNDLIHLM